MRFILEPLFTLFGNRAIGQLIGATLVGAVLPLLVFLKKDEKPPGSYLEWVVGGAIAGFLAGLFLLSPKRFFGAVFGLLGLFVTFVPMNRTDGVPVSIRAFVIKTSIGVFFLALGIWLLVRAWKRLK